MFANSSHHKLSAPLRLFDMQTQKAYNFKEAWDAHLGRGASANYGNGIQAGMSWQDKVIEKYAPDLPLADMIELQESLASAKASEIERAPHLRIREAISITGYPVLQKAGIKQALYKGYKLPTTIFDQLVYVEQSDKMKEEYGGLYEATLPELVKPGREVREGRMGEKAAWIYNYKYAQIMSLEIELTWYDQQKKILSKAKNLGRGFRWRQEKVFVELIIDANDNKFLSGDPATAGALYDATAYGNLLTAALSTANFETACTAFRRMTDDQGNEIMNEPDTFIGPVTLEGTMSRILKARTYAGDATHAHDEYNYIADRYGKNFKVLTSPLFDSDDTTDWYLANRAADQIIYQDVLPLTLAEEPDFVGAGFSHLAKRFLGVIAFGLGVVEPRIVFANRVAG